MSVGIGDVDVEAPQVERRRGKNRDMWQGRETCDGGAGSGITCASNTLFARIKLHKTEQQLVFQFTRKPPRVKVEDERQAGAD